MTYGTKRKTLILLGLVVMTTIIIAASLPQLELQPGMPLPRLNNGQLVAPPTEVDAPAVISVNKFLIILIAVVLAGVTLYSVFRRLRGAEWKDISAFIRSALVIGVFLCGFVFLIMLIPSSGSQATAEIIPTPIPEPPVTAPLGSVPTALLWLVGFGLLGISLLVGVWILKPARRTRPIELVGAEAEKNWRALKTGQDLKGVIIKCYQQMSLALEKEQGIERKDFMTTGEFETTLEAAGMPHDPIHQLTRLFNAARYGHWQPSAVDEQDAIQCLEAIMVYSRGARRKNEQ